MAEKANKLKIKAEAKSGSTLVKEEKKSAPAREIAPKLGFTSSALAHEIAPELGSTSISWCNYSVTRPSVN